MNSVLHCQSFLEVILYNTKAVVHFLLPDFFSRVCVYNTVQYLVLGEEIIFNFDNLIFLVISIRGWVFVLVRGMSVFRENQVHQNIFISSLQPLFSHTQLSSFPFWQQWPEVMQDHKSYKITSPTMHHNTLRCFLNVDVVCGLRPAALEKTGQNTWSCWLVHRWVRIREYIFPSFP